LEETTRVHRFRSGPASRRRCRRGYALVADHAQFLHGLHASLLIAVAAVLATAAASLLLRLARQPRRLPHLARGAAVPVTISLANGE